MDAHTIPPPTFAEAQNLLTIRKLTKNQRTLFVVLKSCIKYFYVHCKVLSFDILDNY